MTPHQVLRQLYPSDSKGYIWAHRWAHAAGASRDHGGGWRRYCLRAPLTSGLLCGLTNWTCCKGRRTNVGSQIHVPCQRKDLMRQNDFLAAAGLLFPFCRRQILAQLRDMYADVSESLIIPSPKSGVASMSEDSTEDSTEVSLRKDLWLSSVDDDATCPAFVGWVVSEEAKQMHANPFDAAMALRSLASFAKIFREANLGGVVMPFMESLDIIWHKQMSWLWVVLVMLVRRRKTDWKIVKPYCRY